MTDPDRLEYLATRIAAESRWAQTHPEAVENMRNNAFCPDSPTGAHHWMLEARATDHKYKGVCKHCGTEKGFPST